MEREKEILKFLRDIYKETGQYPSIEYLVEIWADIGELPESLKSKDLIPHLGTSVKEEEIKY